MSDSITFSDWLKTLPVQTDLSASLVMLTDTQGNSSKTEVMRLKCQILFGISDIGPSYSRIQPTEYTAARGWMDSATSWWSEVTEAIQPGKIVTMTLPVAGTDKSMTLYYLSLDSLTEPQYNGIRYRQLRPLMIEIKGMTPYFPPQTTFALTLGGG